MSKIQMKASRTVAEIFGDFIMSRKAKGLSDKTVLSYKSHLKSIRNHLDIDMSIDDLSKNDLENMVESMRDSGLATNSISSYVRVFKTFLSWCNDEEITDLNMKKYKSEETIKETYTDKELNILLKKPNIRTCGFAEYRTWVIINLLLNNGCRAATVRNIQNKDVDLENSIIYLRHTKNKKSQVIPLCTELCGILKEYIRIRGGAAEDYLFPNESGENLS